MKSAINRVLHYVRIHSGDSDALARAMHHGVQKDTLMTYEKGLLAQADLRIVRGSTIERKKMSTKTLRKRVALTAVIALVTGLVSVAPANAGTLWDGAISGGTGSVTLSGLGDRNAATNAIVERYVTINFDFDGDATEYTLKSTGTGSLFGTLTTDGVFEATNGNNDIAGNGLITGLADGDEVTFKATSATPGTQTITLSPQDGTTSVKSILTITWVTAAAAEVSASNTVVYAADGDCANEGEAVVTRAEALADQTAEAIATVAVGDSFNICILPFDESNSMTEDYDYTAFTSLGGSDSDEGVSNSIETGALEPATTGVAKVTVVITAGSTTITKTLDVIVFGSMKTIALSNATDAAAADGANSDADANGVFNSLDSGDAAEDDIGTPGSSDGALALAGKDSNGNLSDLTDETAGISWTIDSDKVAGTPSAGNSDALATVIFDGDTTESADLLSSHLGGNGVLVRCGASAEKLSITANGFDSAGNAVKSNTVTFYCSDSVDKVSVTGTATSVTAKAVDENGYPVADGTEVTLAASNGSVVAPSSKTTSNGMATVIFIPTASAANSAVTAIVGSKSGTSAALAGSGSSSSAQIKSLVKKINALTKLIAKIQKKLGVK